jgi:hypothetical protein
MAGFLRRRSRHRAALALAILINRKSDPLKKEEMLLINPLGQVDVLTSY